MPLGHIFSAPPVATLVSTISSSLRPVIAASVIAASEPQSSALPAIESSPWDGGIFELLFMLIVFFCILFLAYFTTRFIAKKSMGRFKSRYIEVIDTLGVGVDTQLLIVKVVDEFFLVSKSAKQLAFLTKLALESDDVAENAPTPGFAESFRTLLESRLSNASGRDASGRDVYERDVSGRSTSERNVVSERDASGRSAGKAGVFRGNIDRLRRYAGEDANGGADGGADRETAGRAGKNGGNDDE